MKKILIVEDVDMNVDLLTQLLEDEYELVVANDGLQGVSMAEQVKPDLILMDVVMPNLNGFQATRAISREPTTAHIPVILVTTKDQETDKVWGMRQGAKAYVTKPFSESELQASINAFLSPAG